MITPKNAAYCRQFEAEYASRTGNNPKNYTDDQLWEEARRLFGRGKESKDMGRSVSQYLERRSPKPFPSRSGALSEPMVQIIFEELQGFTSNNWTIDHIAVHSLAATIEMARERASDADIAGWLEDAAKALRNGEQLTNRWSEKAAV